MRTLFLIFLTTCLTPVLLSSNIEGVYANDYPYYHLVITNDTLKIYGMVYFPTCETGYHPILLGECRITNMTCDYYNIETYETPEDIAFKDMTVTSEYCDTIKDIIIKIITSKENPPLRSIIDFNYSKLTITAPETTLHIPNKYSIRYISFYPGFYNSWPFSNGSYIGMTHFFLDDTKLEYLKYGSDNIITINLPNFNDYSFLKFYIPGDIIFCDGKCLRWRNNIFYKVDEDVIKSRMELKDRPIKSNSNAALYVVLKGINSAVEEFYYLAP